MRKDWRIPTWLTMTIISTLQQSADKTPNKGTLRFETRNDDDYFYPDTAYMQTIYAQHSTIVTQPAAESDQKALQLPSAKGRMMNYMENTSTTLSMGYGYSFGQKDKYTRTSFYFPSINQNGLSVTVYDKDSGKELLSTKIDQTMEWYLSDIGFMW